MQNGMIQAQTMEFTQRLAFSQHFLMLTQSYVLYFGMTSILCFDVMMPMQQLLQTQQVLILCRTYWQFKTYVKLLQEPKLSQLLQDNQFRQTLLMIKIWLKALLRISVGQAEISLALILISDPTLVCQLLQQMEQAQ